jgi:hypothetical protein
MEPDEPVDPTNSDEVNVGEVEEVSGKQTDTANIIWVFVSKDSIEIDVFRAKTDVLAYVKTLKSKTPYAVHEINLENGSSKKVIKWPLPKPSPRQIPDLSGLRPLGLISQTNAGKTKSRAQVLDE